MVGEDDVVCVDWGTVGFGGGVGFCRAEAEVLIKEVGVGKEILYLYVGATLAGVLSGLHSTFETRYREEWYGQCRYGSTESSRSPLHAMRNPSLLCKYPRVSNSPLLSPQLPKAIT